MGVSGKSGDSGDSGDWKIEDGLDTANREIGRTGGKTGREWARLSMCSSKIEKSDPSLFTSMKKEKEKKSQPWVVCINIVVFKW